MTDSQKIGEDLRITKCDANCEYGGWVVGTLCGHKFEAKIYPEHAEVATYEIGKSKISKLGIRRLSDRKQVYHWDRGLDMPPADEMAKAILNFLTKNLAEIVFSKRTPVQVSTNLDTAFENIAKEHLGIETLEERKMDALDFHDCAVWTIKSAMKAAFDLGRQAARNTRNGCAGQ